MTSSRNLFAPLGALATGAVLCAAACLASPAEARAELKPEKVRTADSKKNQSYLRDGLFVGGDRAINGVVVKDIRRAVNPGYERIVIDLEGTKNGEPAGIERPPYYQLAVNPDEKRLVFTVWGRPKLELNPRKVMAAFTQSASVSGVQLMPKIEDDSWTFVLELKGGRPVEVFELAHPTRVIVDIKAAAPPPKPAKGKTE